MKRVGLGIAGLVAGAATGPPAAYGTAGTEPFVGQIVLVPYTFAPRGFAFCEGQELPVSQYPGLYALLGTQYGGDGRRTFRLPDTRPVELAAERAGRTSLPPFRHAIALAGVYPSRP